MVDTNRELIEQLVLRPSENLNVEIKTWISPAHAAGQAKIVKAALALRNRNGGFLIIGLNDETLTPDMENAPASVRDDFHADVIQSLVSKYASEPFQVGVEYVERDGIELPVIVIPSGLRTPVAAKADLFVDGNPQIRADEVYFRTLVANNSVSSTKIKWKDWRDLIEICLDNREADIGRFVRRHLAGVGPTMLQELVAALGGVSPPQQPSDSDLMEAVLDEGMGRFEAVVKERGLALPPHGSWEVALIIDGEFTPLPLDQFAWQLNASNPDYTGWPVWLDSRQFSDESARPYVHNGGWESLIVTINSEYFNHIDFMRQAPIGRFYSYRALEDDITSGKNAPKPMKFLDAILPVLRVTEAIAVGLAFAKALQVNEEATLKFAFRWSGLNNRELTSWADPMRYVSSRKTRQDVVVSMVSVPADTPVSALSQHVKTAVQPLYEVFSGFMLPDSVLEDLTQKLIERRL
ncbi:Putative DNA-binding domain-containing protein [Cupriavidus sp. YR651]|uniref:AlbA family DNA-binding domain-containing protein n=1 Tax=Cupriavidus sp. YR651 TaxID=1855315 RepID=UPI0008833A30|nr:RNA-binding domain-containing protein [Cupriavidus sp. YR651]SDC62270.1 Putative DNA-binding domain-containing protein [Cupriavidus sp. YR651]